MNGRQATRLKNPFSPAYQPPPPLHTRLITLLFRLVLGFINGLIERATEPFKTHEVRGIHGSEHKRWQPLFGHPAPILHPNYLSRQPFELIDRVCYFLVEPADLLAFALTSKANHAIVVPRHINFRAIRADVRWGSIWEAIQKNDGVAPRFASLEIISSPTTDNAVVPVALFPAGTSQKIMTNRSWEGPALQHLTKAISKMQGLTRFHWTDASIRLTDQLELLANLRDFCPALEDVHVVNQRMMPRQEMFMDDEYQRVNPNELKRIKANITESPLWGVSDLVRFSFIANGEGGSGVDHSRMYSMLIDRCPRLEELSLYTHTRLHHLFSAGRWPRLTRLSFQGRSLRATDQEIFSQFCTAHRNTLECLQIDGPLAVDLKDIPRLRLLHINFSALARRVPSRTCQGLESLSLVIDAPVGGAPVPLEPMPNLRHLSIAGKTLPPACLNSVADAAPNVEWLGLSSSTWLFFKKNDFSETDGPFSSFLDFISRFTRLTHFSRLGIADGADSEYSTFDNVMERIAWLVPTLQYISVTNGEIGKRTWLAVERYPVDKPGCYVHWAPVRSDLNFPTETLSGFNPFQSGTSGPSPWSGTEVI